MIQVSGISTQSNIGMKTKYRFREEAEVSQAVREAIESRHGRKPIYTGSRGIPVLDVTPDKVTDSIVYQQYLHNKTKGVRVREEMLSVTENELGNNSARIEIERIADAFSDYYMNRGFQTVYGVYTYDDDRGKGYDILYAINTVSFRDGSKYRRNAEEYQQESDKAAKTVVADVTGKTIPESERFNFKRLEYYGV